MATIERNAIENSSNLLSQGYDPETKTLQVEFADGKVGEYSDFPPEVYAEFQTACSDPDKSAGKFFHAHIRNRFPFKYA